MTPQKQLIQIEKFLDAIDVPTKTKTGAEFSTFGRVFWLTDRIKKLEKSRCASCTLNSYNEETKKLFEIVRRHTLKMVDKNEL